MAKRTTGIEPATNAVSITPDTDLAIATRGVYVGVAGDLKVDMQDAGTAVTFVGLAAGIVHPISIKKVYASGTTATNIVGVY